MNRKFRTFFFLFLIFAQIFLNRFFDVNADLLYLIMVYIAVRSNFLKTLISATVIGLFTDFITGSIVIGVFGFSRTLIAYILYEGSKFIDLKKNIFVFFLIAISLSVSNLIANLFFSFILSFKISINLILYQPLITGLIGFLILLPTTIKKKLNVY